MVRCLLAGFLAALTVGAATAAPAPEVWHWVWVRPSADGWSELRGEAPVTVAGQSFATRLRPSSADGGELRLTGRLGPKRSVNATGVLLETDADPMRFQGRYQKTRTRRTDPSNGWGEDRIVLHSGLTFVGLYRPVRSAR